MKARLLGWVGWGAIGAGGGIVFAALTSILLTRTLGRDEYGHYVYWLWAAETFAVIGSAGVPRLIARRVAVDLQSPRVGTLLGCFCMVTTLFVVAISMSTSLGRAITHHTLAGIYALSVVLLITTTPALQAVGAFRFLSAMALVQGFIGAIGAALVAFGGAALEFQLRVVVFCALFVSLVQAVACLRISERREAEKQTGPSQWTIMAGLTVIELIVWQRPEIYFLKVLSSDSELGLYGAAMAVSGRLGVFAQIALPVLFAGFAKEASEATEGARRGYRAATVSLALIGLPVFGAVCLFASRIMIVLFGAEYEGGGRTLAVLSAAGFIALLSIPGSAVIYARRGLERSLIMGVFAAIVTIVANISLVESFGSLGAALGNSAGQFVAVAGSQWWIIRKDGFLFPLKRVVQMIGATALVGCIAWLVTRGLSTPISLVSGITLFWLLLAGLAVQVKPFRMSDASALGLESNPGLSRVIGFVMR